MQCNETSIEEAVFSATLFSDVSEMYLECQGTEEETKHQSLEGGVASQQFQRGEIGHSHLL